VLGHSQQQGIHVGRENRICAALREPLRFDPCGDAWADPRLHAHGPQQTGLNGTATIDFAAAEQSPGRDVDARLEREVDSNRKPSIAAR